MAAGESGYGAVKSKKSCGKKPEWLDCAALYFPQIKRE